MSFFEKWFGKNKGEQSTSPSEPSGPGSQVSNLHQIVTSGAVDEGLAALQMYFSTTMGTDVKTLALAEEDFLQWLESAAFQAEELLLWSDIFTHLAEQLSSSVTRRGWLQSLLLAGNNVNFFAAANEAIDLEPFQANGQRLAQVLQALTPASAVATQAVADSPLDPEAGKRFKEEIEEAIPRYFSTPQDEPVDFTLRNEEGDQVPPHEAYPEQFRQWQGIRSPWDRRSLIYGLLDQIFWDKLQLWQILERFTDDRYCQKALEMAAQYARPEVEEQQAPFCAALGRAQFIAGDIRAAEANLRKALKLDETYRRARIYLADLLHCTQSEKEAHDLYNSVLEAQGLQKETQLELSLTDLLGFGGYLHSPIYALAWLEGHPDVTADTWDWAAAEFYHSPHFRARHAYHLIDKGEAVQGLAKLVSLSQEMPWFREAVVNAHSVMTQLNLTDQMQSDYQRLQKIMDENDWS